MGMEPSDAEPHSVCPAPTGGRTRASLPAQTLLTGGSATVTASRGVSKNSTVTPHAAAVIPTGTRGSSAARPGMCRGTAIQR